MDLGHRVGHYNGCVKFLSKDRYNFVYEKRFYEVTKLCKIIILNFFEIITIAYSLILKLYCK